MDYLLNDEESDNDLASKILYFLIQGFSETMRKSL